jgi:prepilin-type N-terminal cleavage/methylation domain-containing protein
VVVPAGFTLVEILISMVIFSAVILGLVGLSFQSAQRSMQATDKAHVMSQLLASVDRATTIRFDSLNTIAGCDTVMRGTVRVASCTTVTPVSLRTASVRIIVSTSVPGAWPDTVVLTRATPRVPIPLR